MNIDTFINELKELNINPTEEQLKSLEIYKNLLIEYNKKFNLTAITEVSDIYLKHFYDSLTMTKVINLKEKLKVLDIGTGAGFPGLVLKIFYPELEVTLLDSNNKKITFLNTVIEKLNLKNIKCIHGRVEELDKSYREYFDIVTSRAVANLRILAELSIPYLKVHGKFISMKGNVEEELEEAKSTIDKLKGKIVRIETFKLPIENSNRTIIEIEKEEKTSDIYPRKYNEITKKILK